MLLRVSYIIVIFVSVDLGAGDLPCRIAFEQIPVDGCRGDLVLEEIQPRLVIDPFVQWVSIELVSRPSDPCLLDVEVGEVVPCIIESVLLIIG